MTMKKLTSLLLSMCFIFVAFTQNVGIGISTPLGSKLVVINNEEGNAAAVAGLNNGLSGQRFGIRGEIAGPVGASVFGYSTNGAAASAGFEPNHYGVMGITGATGVSVAGFTLQGTAIRGSASPGGKALFTSGSIKLSGIGEAVNRVLVSDVEGNATWQTVPAHSHFGDSWSGSAANGLIVNNFQVAGTGIRGTGESTGVTGYSDNATGIGLLGVNNSSGNHHPIFGNTAVAGVAGTGIGVYAAAVQGTSLLVDKQNFGASGGIVAIIQNNKTGLTTPVLQVKGVSNQPVLELNNGFLQVSGSTRTAFKHTTSAGNITSNFTRLEYANAAETDIVIVTHNFDPSNTYLNKNFGVFWNGGITNKWCIYLEDLSGMPTNIVFNVLIIKNP